MSCYNQLPPINRLLIKSNNVIDAFYILFSFLDIPPFKFMSCLVCNPIYSHDSSVLIKFIHNGLINGLIATWSSVNTRAERNYEASMTIYVL